MKVTHYLPLAAACLMMVGCGTGKQKAEMTAGIQLANLDTTALPGSSFYQYACGGWIESHPLSPEYSQYGSSIKPCICLRLFSASSVKEPYCEYSGESGYKV